MQVSQVLLENPPPYTSAALKKMHAMLFESKGWFKGEPVSKTVKKVAHYCFESLGTTPSYVAGLLKVIEDGDFDAYYRNGIRLLGAINEACRNTPSLTSDKIRDLRQVSEFLSQKNYYGLETPDELIVYYEKLAPLVLPAPYRMAQEFQIEASLKRCSDLDDKQKVFPEVLYHLTEQDFQFPVPENTKMDFLSFLFSREGVILSSKKSILWGNLLLMWSQADEKRAEMVTEFLEQHPFYSIVKDIPQDQRSFQEIKPEGSFREYVISITLSVVDEMCKFLPKSILERLKALFLESESFRNDFLGLVVYRNRLLDTPLPRGYTSDQQRVLLAFRMMLHFLQTYLKGLTTARKDLETLFLWMYSSNGCCIEKLNEPCYLKQDPQPWIGLPNNDVLLWDIIQKVEICKSIFEKSGENFNESAFSIFISIIRFLRLPEPPESDGNSISMENDELGDTPSIAEHPYVFYLLLDQLQSLPGGSKGSLIKISVEQIYGWARKHQIYNYEDLRQPITFAEEILRLLPTDQLEPSLFFFPITLEWEEGIKEYKTKVKRICSRFDLRGKMPLDSEPFLHVLYLDLRGEIPEESYRFFKKLKERNIVLDQNTMFQLLVNAYGLKSAIGEEVVLAVDKLCRELKQQNIFLDYDTTLRLFAASYCPPRKGPEIRPDLYQYLDKLDDHMLDHHQLFVKAYGEECFDPEKLYLCQILVWIGAWGLTVEALGPFFEVYSQHDKQILKELYQILVIVGKDIHENPRAIKRLISKAIRVKKQREEGSAKDLSWELAHPEPGH